VDHVVHYDLPRSLEVFVHRSGRTARARREGLCFSIVAPRDERMQAEVCASLLPSGHMPAFPVDLRELNGARERVSVAGRLVGFDKEAEKRNASKAWFVKSARDAGLELDEETLREEESGSQKDRQRAAQMAADRKRLAELLPQPLCVERKKFVDVSAKLAQLEAVEGLAAREVLGKAKGEGRKRKHR
jgi:ATP-dependent RNA helicase DDX24/MAK5